MKKRLTRIGPIRAGIILGIMYGVLGLLVAPVMLLAAMMSKNAGTGAVVGGMAVAIAMPLIYAVVGFIGGIIAAALYNLIAKWTGGLQLEFADDDASGQTTSF